MALQNNNEDRIITEALIEASLIEGKETPDNTVALVLTGIACDLYNKDIKNLKSRKADEQTLRELARMVLGCLRSHREPLDNLTIMNTARGFCNNFSRQPKEMKTRHLVEEIRRHLRVTLRRDERLQEGGM